ncbi:site-specific DNA-methyltransferase, partial [Methanosphaera stadtmanae]|uniref:site-specific DNA-methyltransferase n=1 Tax=Methanosphaera stadtmanae TaxID=2317 RepID=UPI002E759BF1
YNFTWKGKTESIQIAQTPSTGTLRPCKEESKNWDITQNLYIEGDNLEVLKLLQKTYSGKIKMIYIDPPYNTGKDFIYKDNYRDNLENYIEQDENGFKTSSKQETSGRYHTNWLNMMYPRLKLARNLLKEDGVIFISIDDNEVENLKKICNEIFGESNFITQIIVKTGGPGGFKTRANKPVKVKEYELIYAKNKINFVYEKVFVERSGKWDDHFNLFFDKFSNEIFPLKELLIKHNILDKKDKLSELDINNKTFKKFYMTYSQNICDTKYYRESDEKNESLKRKNEVISFLNSEGRTLYLYNGRLLNFLENSLHSCDNKKSIAIQLSDVWTDITYNNIQNEINIVTFSNGQKPIRLIKRNLEISNTTNEIILDFFSGSSTTAHAVMKKNVEDNGNRKFIMVQLPEQTDEKSEAYKAGFSNICEIGKERIRSAGDKIVEESGNSDLDIGFKVFKLDSSNIMKWNPDYNNIRRNLLAQTDNIVEGRSELDLVYEIMLKYGINITLPIDEYNKDGYKLYSVGAGALIICLDDMITKDVANSIVDLKNELNPFVSRVVLKDGGFVNDADKVNVREILKNNEIEEFITI